MIDTSIEVILEHALKKKKISTIPQNPVGQKEAIKKIFKNNKELLEILDLYEFFKKVKELRYERVGEFRKNVALKVMYKGNEVVIDLEKLKEYAEKLEKFISTTKQFLLS